MFYTKDSIHSGLDAVMKLSYDKRSRIVNTDVSLEFYAPFNVIVLLKSKRSFKV